MQLFVKAAQAGDMVAWNFLYRQHYPWMYAMALRIYGNSPAASDAVQEAFINAYLRLQQLKDPDAFAGWLKTILVRHCRRNRKREWSYTHKNFSLPEPGSLCEDELNRKLDWYAQRSRLYATLAGLPEILQSVLLLRYFSNWQSYEQIAAILCIPAGTVRSRLNQAKKKITEHWEKYNDDNDRALLQSLEWNDLYNNYFGNVYTSLHHREKLIEHFDKNLELVFTSGKTVSGRTMVEQQIEEDILYGTHFEGLQVSSSSTISIVEAHNINSDEYPDRCPGSTVFVLYRTGNKVTKLTLHHSAK